MPAKLNGAIASTMKVRCMADLFSLSGLVLSTGSLVVSIIALWKSSHAQHEANAAHKRLVEIEEQREKDRQAQLGQAKLRPELRKTSRGSHRLYIVNHGDVEARNIRVEVDDTPLIGHPAAVQGSPMPGFVGPHCEISCQLGLHLGCAPPFKIRVKWDDDLRKNREIETALTW